MELFSLKRICLDSVSNHLSMWCQSAKTEDFFKYMYVIGPFNDVGRYYFEMLANFINS